MSSTNQVAFPTLRSGSYSSYLNAVMKIPTLSIEEENKLAVDSYNNDHAASQKLITHHLKQVANIASKYKGYGMPPMDLVQEGNVGLMKAVKRFDPAVGVRLSSFASYWIKSEIHEYVLKNYHIAKVATTKAQRKLFFNIRKNKSGRTMSLTHEEATNLAEELSVKVSEVKEMERRMGTLALDIDSKVDDGENKGSDLTLAGVISNNSILDDEVNDELESNWEQVAFRRELSKLNDRAKDIISSRHLSESKATLDELSLTYNVSAERIRQIEKESIEKIKQGVREFI